MHRQPAMFHRNCSSLESQNSSTWIELATVRFALEAFVEQLCAGRVCWNTDSRNVATILQVGSMIQELADLALGIFQFSVSRQIHLDNVWISWNQNAKADMLS